MIRAYLGIDFSWRLPIIFFSKIKKKEGKEGMRAKERRRPPFTFSRPRVETRSWWWRACLNSTGFDCARKGASAQPTSGWGGDAFDSGGHPCGLGGDGSRGEKYECWSTRVAERQGSAGTVEGGRGSSESLETPTMLSLSTQSRKQSQSREYTRSVFVVSRTASSFSICSLSTCRRVVRFSCVCYAWSNNRSTTAATVRAEGSRKIGRAETFGRVFLQGSRAKGFERSKYASTCFDLDSGEASGDNWFGLEVENSGKRMECNHVSERI